MDFFRRLAQQLREVWNGMGNALRFLLVIALVLGVVMIGVVGYFAFQPQYGALYRNLPPEVAQSIRERLDAQRIPYQLAEGGTSVLVPVDRVSSLRVELAGEGLLGQSKGYELLDEPSLGSTPFRDSVNYLRAKQAELARTVRGLEPVLDARVEIAKPEPSPFVRDQKPTTASVLVKLRPGMSLQPKQVHGIVALVSRAVEGLTAENVSVVDGKGQVLSDSGAGDIGAATTQLDYRRALESYLTSKAEGILTKVLGPGRSTVQVTADVNFKRLREMRETYNPEGKALRTEKTTTKKTTPNSGASGGRGPAGTTSNLPGRNPATGGAAGGGSGPQDSEETSETMYEVSRIRQELEDSLGSVERLTVAATVDLSAPEGSTAAPTLAKPEVERLIKQAIGFRQDRGDEIQVSEAKLAGVPPTAEPTTPTEPTEGSQIENITYWVNVGSKAALGLAVLLVAVALALALLRVARPAAPPPAPPTRTVIYERLASVAQRDPEALARALATLMEQP